MKRNIPEIRYTHSSLVANFAKADPPVVWRFDLERNHSFSVALRPVNEVWELGVTLPNGEFHIIARFNEGAEAEVAYRRLAKVLAQGRFSWVRVMVKGFVVVLVLLAVLYVTLLALQQGRFAASSHVVRQEEAPAAVAGEPVPADEVLTPPSP